MNDDKNVIGFAQCGDLEITCYQYQEMFYVEGRSFEDDGLVQIYLREHDTEAAALIDFAKSVQSEYAEV